MGDDPILWNCVGSRSSELNFFLDKTTEAELICLPPSSRILLHLFFWHYSSAKYLLSPTHALFFRSFACSFSFFCIKLNPRNSWLSKSMSRVMLLLGCTCVLCTFVGSAADAHHLFFSGVPAFGRCTLASIGTPVAARCGQRRHRPPPTATQGLRMQLYKSDYLSDPLPDPDRSQSGWPGTGNIGPFDVDLPAIPVMTGPLFTLRLGSHSYTYGNTHSHTQKRGKIYLHMLVHTHKHAHTNWHLQNRKRTHTFSLSFSYACIRTRFRTLSQTYTRAHKLTHIHNTHSNTYTHWHAHRRTHTHWHAQNLTRTHTLSLFFIRACARTLSRTILLTRPLTHTRTCTHTHTNIHAHIHSVSLSIINVHAHFFSLSRSHSRARACGLSL